MNKIHHVTWRFPPTKERSGNAKAGYDQKDIVLISSDIFLSPTIVTSDLHSHSYALFSLLKEFIDL